MTQQQKGSIAMFYFYFFDIEEGLSMRFHLQGFLNLGLYQSRSFLFLLGIGITSFCFTEYRCNKIHYMNCEMNSLNHLLVTERQ